MQISKKYIEIKKVKRVSLTLFITKMPAKMTVTVVIASQIHMLPASFILKIRGYFVYAPFVASPLEFRIEEFIDDFYRLL